MGVVAVVVLVSVIWWRFFGQRGLRRERHFGRLVRSKDSRRGVSGGLCCRIDTERYLSVDENPTINGHALGGINLQLEIRMC